MQEDVKIIQDSEGCTAYDCDLVLYICLEKGVTVSDHTHNHQETVFLMDGIAEAIIGDEIKIINSPAKVVIPPNVYHKFTAITNLIGLEIK